MLLVIVVQQVAVELEDIEQQLVLSCLVNRWLSQWVQEVELDLRLVGLENLLVNQEMIQS